MEPRIPDVELFIVFKWIIVLMVVSALGTLASLMVKKFWYGSEKHNRREDSDETEVGRGWVERFLEGQKQHTEATVELRNEMHGVMDALKDNGEAVRDLGRNLACRYPDKRAH